MKKGFTVNYMLLIISIIGLVATSYSRYDEMKGIILNDFVKYGKAKGQIIKSDTKRISGYRGTSIETYDIEYSYAIDGKVYLSDQIDFLVDHGNYKKYLDEYPVGKSVDVYYDTENYGFSVLRPESYSLFVFGLPLFWLAFLTYSVLRLLNENLRRMGGA